MLALVIELLGGRYVATSFNDREQVEWPPHPARLYSALVATWADADPHGAGGEAEAQALRWLEQQPAPEILASPTDSTGRRSVVPMYVAVNDVSVISHPSRMKLEEAEHALAEATTPKDRAKAEKDVARLQQKLIDDTAKATAAPTKFAKDAITAAAWQIPEARMKQARTFPSASPEHPRFAMVWAEATATPSTLEALGRLASRLVRVGHSSTLVTAKVVTDSRDLEPLVSATTRFIPSEAFGDLAIRWVGPGQLDRLNAAYELHQETEPRVLPSKFMRYHEQASGEPADPPAEAIESVFGDDFIVFARTDGPRLPGSSTVGVTRQLRRALMALADQPVHEVISGHTPDGAASSEPHLAIAALPFVAGPHPDGSLLGLAVILPRCIDPAARGAVMRAIGRFEEQHRGESFEEAPCVQLMLGRAGILQLQRVAWGADRRSTLRPSTWSRAATRWASAVPVALDRNPGDLSHRDPRLREQAHAAARATIAEAAKRIGLPAPVEIDVTRAPVLPGSAETRSYPRFPIETRRPQRVLVHVRLRFAEPVRGPILLGAGRFYGLGLCLPLPDPRSNVNDLDPVL